MGPSQASRGGAATVAAPPTVTCTPRLLPAAAGWWYLGGRRLVLLDPGAADATGRLDPAVERQLRAAGANGPTPVPAYALTALTTTACNLGCGYCFQNTAQDPRGGSQPPRIDGLAMSRQTARETVRFAAARMAGAGLDALDVELSGGEPLLNPAGCRDLLEFAGQRGLRSARLVSNGTLLTRTLARELAGAGLRTVRVTFDGRRADHDLIRVRRSGGEGTFDVILTRLATASAATDLRWDLRVNVSHRNRDGLHALLDQLAERVDPGRCHVSFALLNDTGIGYPNPLARDSDLVGRFVGWLRHAAERGFRLHRPVAIRPCPTCPDPGRLGAVVSADGTLYSCVEAAGRPGRAAGTVRVGYRPAAAGSCGGRSPALRAFRDAVDARLLDFLHATGRLGTPARLPEPLPARLPEPPADAPSECGTGAGLTACGAGR
ncbi:MAG: uncharacterized protein V7637_5346 [Mycobacteriales bacterium]